jgi:dienelactone hydrolase
MRLAASAVVPLLLPLAACWTVRGEDAARLTAAARVAAVEVPVDLVVRPSSPAPEIRPSERSDESPRAVESFALTIPPAPGDPDPKPSKATILLPAGESPVPAVLLFPILAGGDDITRYLETRFVRAGFAVLSFERRKGLLDRRTDEHASRETLARTVRDARRLVDWWTSHRRAREGEIATVGVSMGGIHAALLMGVEPRLRAGSFLLAGGDLPKLLAESGEDRVVRYRDEWMAKNGKSLAEYRAAAAEFLGAFDPVAFAPRVDPWRVRMMNGALDRVVPAECRDALWEAFGRPEMEILLGGHYGSIVYLPHAFAQSIAHIRRVFARDAGGAPVSGPDGGSTAGDRAASRRPRRRAAVERRRSLAPRGGSGGA